MEAGLAIEDYLKRGGVISAPGNAPARYRAEIMRLMASFVDSELAGAAGFADLINEGPGIKERIAASRIVLEKLDHAEKILRIMGDFGADTDRYMRVHPWAKRVAREADLGATRIGGDMRLNVFHYPISGWRDAVVFNVLMGKATVIQLREFENCSYQPLAEAFHEILPREERHMQLGEEGIQRLLAQGADKRDFDVSWNYWLPRVAASFGGPDSARFDMLKNFGIRHRSNQDLHDEWMRDVERYAASAFASQNHSVNPQ